MLRDIETWLKLVVHGRDYMQWTWDFGEKSLVGEERSMKEARPDFILEVCKDGKSHGIYRCLL